MLKTISLNKTDLVVTPMCLGTVNYGSDMSEADSIRQLNEYTELGGNFIDTAHLYGDWNPGDGPRSEIAIGKWLKERGGRNNVVICTKGAHPVVMHIPRCSDAEIQADLDDSLKSLNTDYIDIYFLHRDDPNRPASEIIEFLEKKVKEGKIRYYGCSNWKLDRIKEANQYAKIHGMQGFCCNQLMWSLAEINFDGLSDKTFVLMDSPTYRYHEETGLNVMAYMSVAKGYFARRLNGETLPQSVKDVYDNEANEKIYAILKDVCAKSPEAVTDYTFRYLMDEHPFPSVPVASFDNFQQLKDGMSSVEANIDVGVLKKLALCKAPL